MEEVHIPEKFKDFVATIEGLTALDLAELVKILEKRFGVSAAPVAMTAAQPLSGGDTGVEAAEEKTEFTVILKEAGAQKINVIKAVRELTGKGLKESKDLVEAAPQTVAEGVKKEQAEEMKKKLEAAGAVAELK